MNPIDNEPFTNIRSVNKNLVFFNKGRMGGEAVVFFFEVCGSGKKQNAKKNMTRRRPPIKKKGSWNPLLKYIFF